MIRLLIWLLPVIISSALWLVNRPDQRWIVPVLVVMWLVTLGSRVARLRLIISVPVRWLRERPALYWLALLVYVIWVLVAWLVPYQPTNGRLLEPVEYILLLAGLWGFLYLTAYDFSADQLHAMGAKLSQSRVAGLLITITTLLLVFMAAEFGLRVFYITTDGYGFTAMNYHWYKNFYWGHYNSVGYRDYEPIIEGVDQRIAILGDSFAMGHGINNLDATFAQLLEQQLGTGYDVNVVAQSGWDSDIELHYLQEYPLQPDVVVLSYYLNDIDHLLTDPSQDPNAAFDFPENPALSWFVLNFFTPNFIYYNVMQYTSPLRATNFTNRLLDAHMDDDLWAQQAWWLNEMVEYTRQQDMHLIVLVWPQLLAIDESIPATTRIRDFFLERDIEVVDMTDILRDYDGRQLIVNRFDAHPGVLAQQLAAEQLYNVLAS